MLVIERLPEREEKIWDWLFANGSPIGRWDLQNFSIHML